MPKSNSKIENSIQELENFLENCKKVPLSPNKIMVNREELEYIIEDIKKNIPEEVERYRKVISNKEAIEKEAQERASELIKLATDKTNELLSENEIMLQARQKADEIVDMAAKQAQEIYDDAVMQGNAYKASAQQYLNDMLVNLHDLIYSCVDQTTRNTNKFLDSLKDVGSTVTDNLNELNGYSVPEEEASEEQPAIEPLDLDLPEE
ncbi:MAG TPA: vacuolar family H+-ATPase subunit H [Lachnospiraceae bacterium]|jgi:dsDNA-specific endonuclease/ATPase MutS2|nr:vacuolar family H+-ATPase subunit H [Lachnospiraceae bacterium]